jgi:hypothetical protein
MSYCMPAPYLVLNGAKPNNVNKFICTTTCPQTVRQWGHLISWRSWPFRGIQRKLFTPLDLSPAQTTQTWQYVIHKWRLWIGWSPCNLLSLCTKHISRHVTTQEQTVWQIGWAQITPSSNRKLTWPWPKECKLKKWFLYISSQNQDPETTFWLFDGGGFKADCCTAGSGSCTFPIFRHFWNKSHWLSKLSPELNWEFLLRGSATEGLWLMSPEFRAWGWESLVTNAWSCNFMFDSLVWCSEVLLTMSVRPCEACRPKFAKNQKWHNPTVSQKWYTQQITPDIAEITPQRPFEEIIVSSAQTKTNTTRMRVIIALRVSLKKHLATTFITTHWPHQPQQ